MRRSVDSAIGSNQRFIFLVAIGTAGFATILRRFAGAAGLTALLVFCKSRAVYVRPRNSLRLSGSVGRKGRTALHYCRVCHDIRITGWHTIVRLLYNRFPHQTSRNAWKSRPIERSEEWQS